MPWLSIRHGANWACMSVDTLRALVNNGSIPSYYKPSGKQRIVNTDDIDNYIRTHYAPGICEAAARRVVA